MTLASVSAAGLTVVAFCAGVFLAAGVEAFLKAFVTLVAILISLTFFAAAGAFSLVAAGAATGAGFSFLATGVGFFFFGAAYADYGAGVVTGITVGVTIGAGAFGAGPGGSTTFGLSLAAGLFLPASLVSFGFFTVVDSTVAVYGLAVFAAA